MFRAQLRENLYLQLLEERHAPEVFSRIDKDRAYLREWLPWVDATETVDDTLSFIRSTLEQFSSNKGFVAGIWSDRKFCGVIGIHKLDLLNRNCEIGYWLGHKFPGPGHHHGGLPSRRHPSFDGKRPEPSDHSMCPRKRKKLCRAPPPRLRR